MKTKYALDEAKTAHKHSLESSKTTIQRLVDTNKIKLPYHTEVDGRTFLLTYKTEVKIELVSNSIEA